MVASRWQMQIPRCARDDNWTIVAAVVANDHRPFLSEYFDVERKVFFRIFPDCLDQFPRLYQHLVAVVVESWILEQHSRRAFALLQAVGECGEIRHEGLQVLGE